MAIPDSFLDDLVSRVDITELVGGYVRLTKRSGSNLFGLCPFHSEKTPSFSVSSEKQIYHCFGCGKGGGAINFIMEIENLPFREAVELLASRAGMTVPEDGSTDELAGKRKRMLELNRDAARHFHDALKSPAASAAREYLTRRGISKAMVTRFGIGAAPDSWVALLDAMAKKGYSKQEIIDAGLARTGRNEGGAYDFFRNRLMFPVIDVRGGVIGFSGRILGDGEPKYLNSPDTLVFNKSRSLFALNLARKTKSGMLMLAEGNIDVVMLHQAGFDCAVASLGTSLSADQARLMSRYASTAVIAFDSDEAGRKAALRAIGLVEKTGMSIKVIDLGDSKDPDEFLRKHGADAFSLLLERSDNHIEYRLMNIAMRADLTSDEGRLAYIAAATDMLSELDSKPEREVYGIKVASLSGVSRESVESEVEKKVRIKGAKQRKEQEKRSVKPANQMQPIDIATGYKNEYSSAAEEGLIRCFMRDPILIETAAKMGFTHKELTSQLLLKVYGILTSRITQGKDTRASLIMSELEKNEASQLAVILQKPEVIPPDDKTVMDYIERIRTEKYKTDDPDGSLLLEIKQFKGKKDVGGGAPWTT